MAARTPIPSGLRGGNPEGEAGEERVGETRVAERAAARGDGENLERGPGALESWGGGSEPGARRRRQGLKKGLDEERSLWGGVRAEWEPEGVVEEWGLGRGLGGGEGVELWD